MTDSWFEFKPTRAQVVTRYLQTILIAYRAGVRDCVFLHDIAPTFNIGARIYISDDLQEAWDKGWADEAAAAVERETK